MYFSKEMEYMQCSELILLSLSITDFVRSDFFLLAEESSIQQFIRDRSGWEKRVACLGQEKGVINHPNKSNFGTVKGSVLLHTIILSRETTDSLWKPFLTSLMHQSNNSFCNTPFSGLPFYSRFIPGQEAPDSCVASATNQRPIGHRGLLSHCAAAWSGKDGRDSTFLQ